MIRDCFAKSKQKKWLKIGLVCWMNDRTNVHAITIIIETVQLNWQQHFSVDVESRIPVSSKLLANVDISCYERHTFAAYATKTHRHHPKLFVDIYCLHSICAFAKCGVRTKNTSILMAFGFSLLFFSLSNFHYKFNLYE